MLPSNLKGGMMRFTATVLIGVLATFATNAVADARCRDFRKTCEFLNVCMRAASDTWRDKINQGLREKNGHFVWEGLYLCDSHPVMEPPDGRAFDDISAGCTDPEYLSIAEHRMNCNALPE